MDKKLGHVTNFIKKNPVTIAAAGAAIVLAISVVGYSQSHQSALTRKSLDADAKLASQIEDSKKQNGERVAKVAAEKKVAEEKAAAEAAAAKKAAEEKAAADAAAAEKKKTYTYETEKKKEQPTYETVSVSLAKSGSSVVATIGTSKAGTCYFGFKQYDDAGNKLNYTETSSTATNGTCSSVIPDGAWTHAYVTYKASDYSAKGYSDKIAL